MTTPPKKRTRRKAADRAAAGEPQPHSAKIRRQPIPSVDEMPPPALDPSYEPDGAGRPREHRYPELFGEMPPPPKGDPFELAVWCMEHCSIAMHETAQGRGNVKLNSELRAFAGTIGRLIPAERVMEAERLLRAGATPDKPGRTKGAMMTKKTGKTTAVRK